MGKIRFFPTCRPRSTGRENPAFKAHAGKSTVVLGELERLRGAHVALRIHGEMTQIEGTVAVDSAEFDRILGHPEGWRYRTEGWAKDVVFECGKLPGLVRIRRHPSVPIRIG